MAPKIGMKTSLKGTFEEAIQKTTDALKTEGFGVLTRIDVRDTFKQKLNVDFRRYVILGACNPTLAHRALSANADAGLLLPCNVTVEEADSEIVVAAVDPVQMLGVLGNDPILKQVATEAQEKLKRVVALLK